MPGKKIRIAELAEQTTQLIEVAVIAASQAGSSPEADAAALTESCVRACGHWVGLRFPDPSGMQRLTDDERRRVNEFLDQQRSLNRADCEHVCTAAGNPARPRCILQSMTVEESEACAR